MFCIGQVNPSSLKGIFVDVAVKVVSVWWNAKKTFQSILDALYASTTNRIKKDV